MSKIINNDKLLEIFYINSYRWYHVREISRVVGLSPSTGSKYLNSFVKEGLLKKKEERKHLLFKADTENKGFILNKINYNIQKIKRSGLIEYLEEEFNYPQTIILFGSYAKGENIPDSDIDIFILTETKKEPDLSIFRKKLNTEIQLFIYNHKKFKVMQKNNKGLFINIINGIK